MSNRNETTNSFAEVFSAPGVSAQLSGRDSSADNRVTVYYRGMKVYIPDNFQPDTLRQLLMVLKEL